jgi:hypothetical protein
MSIISSVKSHGWDVTNLILSIPVFATLSNKLAKDISFFKSFPYALTFCPSNVTSL